MSGIYVDLDSSDRYICISNILQPTRSSKVMAHAVVLMFLFTLTLTLTFDLCSIDCHTK